MSNLTIAQGLKELERKWPNNLMLFASSGTLLLVDSTTARVVARFGGISCDGGDPNIIEIRGDEYIEHFYADIRNAGKSEVGEKKTHWIDNSRSAILWWTFCGLCSSVREKPYKMTYAKCKVTCKNCLRGSRPKEHLDD